MSGPQQYSQFSLQPYLNGQFNIQSSICGHKLSKLCVAPDCQEYSFHCEERKCQKSNKKHWYCKNVYLDGVADLLNQHINSNHKFIAGMIEIQKRCLQNIINQQEKLQKKVIIGNLQEKYERIICEIFKNGNQRYLKGRDADDFFNKLMSLNNNKRDTGVFLDRFEAAVKRTFAELDVMREQITNQYLSSFKSDDPKQPISKILDAKNQEDSCIDISELQRQLIKEEEVNIVENKNTQIFDMKMQKQSLKRQLPLQNLFKDLSDRIVKMEQKINSDEIKWSSINQNLENINKLVKIDLGDISLRVSKLEIITKQKSQQMIGKMKQIQKEFHKLQRDIKIEIYQHNPIKQQLIFIENINPDIRQIEIPAQSQIIQRQFRIDSNILNNDPERQIKQEYLLKQLGVNSQFKLLFRASQHNFEAASFHKYCDNIPNTLTIVRTEFNKTIAAFTSQKWLGTNANGNGKYIADSLSNTFLLQLQLKEKMTLIQGCEQYAIYDRFDFGPTLGDGDLYLADKCNINTNSYADFPFCYNNGDKYVNNEQSWAAFSGSQQQPNFRVIEYQVFEVRK